MFYPWYKGSEKLLKKNIITKKEIKIIVCGCLIAQMKRLDALVTMQKTPTLKTVPLLRKSGKTTKTVFFYTIVTFVFFLDFFSNGTFQRVRFFCIVISASRSFI